MTVADVYINIPVKSIARAFTYIVPETLMQIGAGWRVLVPFGEVQVEGFVVETRPYDPVRDGGYHLREIHGTVDAEAWFTPALFASTQALAEFYLCAPAEMMRLFMPGKSGVHIFPIYRAKADSKNHPLLSDMQVNAVYEALLQSEGQRLSELRQALPHISVDTAIEKLLRYRLIHKEYLADERCARRFPANVHRHMHLRFFKHRQSGRRKHSQKRGYLHIQSKTCLWQAILFCICIEKYETAMACKNRQKLWTKCL